MATSDEQAHADAWLDAPKESDPGFTRSRTCEGCGGRVMYSRLTWDAVYDARTGIGHRAGCKALAHWAVLEANGATTWEEPPAGGGEQNIFLSSGFVLLSNASIDLETLSA